MRVNIINFVCIKILKQCLFVYSLNATPRSPQVFDVYVWICLCSYVASRTNALESLELGEMLYLYASS